MTSKTPVNSLLLSQWVSKSRASAQCPMSRCVAQTKPTRGAHCCICPVMGYAILEAPHAPATPATVGVVHCIGAAVRSPRRDLESMGRCARVGALGLCMLVGRAIGHMNSEVNLARSRRLQEDGTMEESVNAKWQCEADEVRAVAHGPRPCMGTRCVRLPSGSCVVSANCA